jgi:hypothetical protein
MAESFTQLKPNSTGNKVRERQTTIGANDVRSQGVYQTAPFTYTVVAQDCAFANSKQHISVFNGSGSGKIVRIKKLYMINASDGTLISGAAIRMNVRLITACSGGTDLTANKHDILNDDVPAQVLLKTNATVTESSLLYPLTISNDENLITGADMSSQLRAGINWQPEGAEIQEYALREGQGFTVRQVTNATVGAYHWFIVFSVEED